MLVIQIWSFLVRASLYQLFGIFWLGRIWTSLSSVYGIHRFSPPTDQRGKGQIKIIKSSNLCGTSYLSKCDQQCFYCSGILPWLCFMKIALMYCPNIYRSTWLCIPSNTVAGDHENSSFTFHAHRTIVTLGTALKINCLWFLGSGHRKELAVVEQPSVYEYHTIILYISWRLRVMHCNLCTCERLQSLVSSVAILQEAAGHTCIVETACHHLLILLCMSLLHLHET